MGSSTDQNRLFVYGTLREDFENPMADLLQKYARKLGPASFQGKLFYVQSHPATIQSDDESDTVKGELYEIQKTDLLQKLDHYEGYNPEYPQKSLYLRKQVTVRFRDNDLKSWIYLYNRSTEHAAQIEHGDILKYFCEN